MRPELEVPPPGAHGGDVKAVARALGISVGAILDLSVTMNPLAPDVVPIIRQVAEQVRSYPDPSEATDILSQAIGIDPERVLLTNGGAEAIALVAGELGSATIIEPEFSLWRRHLESTHAASSDDRPSRVRSNPNNPTGLLALAIERAAAWDEAFYPLATGQWTRNDADRGAIVVGSLTKLFSCPGLRLGYVLAGNGEVIDRLRRRQPEWSVNALALGALPVLLERTELEVWARELVVLRHTLSSLFETAGFSVDEGDAPWVLVHEAAWLRPLLARQGVLVRDCASFNMPGTIRVAVPESLGLERLARALEEAIGVHR